MEIDFKDPKYYTNRELSWVLFDYRVLNEARDKSIPLFERLKFLSITASNLDEFFMIRVASLKDMENAGYTKKDIAGMTPTEQLKALHVAIHELVDLQYSSYNRSLLPLLEQLCSCIWIVCFFFSRKSLFRFQASLLGLSPGRIFSILSLGFTPFIMTLTECAIQIVFNINLNRATGGNKDYTAALTVMLSALQLISLPLNGLGNGMQPFVSYNYGKADSARLKQGIKYVTIIAFIYAVCIWSVSMAFPVVYARLFSASEAVTQIVMRYTPMFLMGSIMFFVQMTLQNVNVGLGQAKEALLLAVNRKVVILIPLCFALTHFLGFKGVYLSEGIADLVAGIVTAIVIFTSFPKIFRRREEEVKQAVSN